MATSNRLKIAHAQFEVAECRLFSLVDREGLRWSIELTCAKGVLDDVPAQPRAESDFVFHSPAGPDWRVLFPRREVLADPDTLDADPVATLYVFEHMPIRQNQVEFGPATGAVMSLHWTGLCDVLLNERYGRDLPFRVDCLATFTGVSLGRMTEAEARQRVAPHANLDQFDYVISSGIARFVPRCTPTPGLEVDRDRR